MSSGDPRIERLSAEEAFSLVSDETRFATLAELQDAKGPLAFSELRERVGVEDPGRFNYHLGELTGQFVAKTDDGYEILPPGERLVGAVLAGGVTAALDADPVPVDGNCLTCGAPLVARFRDHGVSVDCTECESGWTDPEVPAGLLAGHDAEEAPEVLANYSRLNMATMDAGICSNCYGQLDRTLYLSDDEGAPDWLADSGLIGMEIHECERCGNLYNAAVQFAVLSHPRVAGYHHEHGIDLRETPTWELDWLETGRGEVESRDPLRIALPIPLDDETRTFVFDEDLDVVEIRHS